LSPKYAVDVPEVSKGSASCLNESNRSFSGHYDSITLDNCANARISGAKLRQLTVKASSLTIEGQRDRRRRCRALGAGQPDHGHQPAAARPHGDSC